MEDLISNLPDSLITHIISCLPTKDAVRTSVLSKKWINHWISITKLDLDDGLFYSQRRNKSGAKQNFINFVNRILLFTPRNNVENLSLVITKDYDASLLNAWIFCILEKCVKQICINANCEVPFSTLTSHYLFYHSNHLEELVLKMCCCAIKVPPSSYGYFTFGSLKVLNLCAIIFTIEESLVIHLPVLTKFKTKNCLWLSAYDVTIEAPQLKTVCIKEDFKPTSIRKLRSCKIKFSASCLKEFTYCGHDGIRQPIVLSNPSVAYNAYVNIIIYKRGSTVDREIGSGACLLLKQFSQAKCIKFHIWGEALTQQKIAVLPTFVMLSHLDLGFVSGGVLLSFLQKTPLLNTLVFQGISKFNQELLNSAVVPNCLASTLKVVKFDNARVSEPELFCAKFLIKNCTVLERMSFSLVNGRKGKSQVIEEFKEKLYLSKKEVSSVIVEFD